MVLSSTPRRFCWTELATTDTAQARTFYQALLGCEFRDEPFPGGTYTTMVRNGQHIAGLFEQSSEMRELALGAHFMSYVGVDSIEHSVRRARELGAEILAEPFDSATRGRMALLLDPTGALVAMCEPHGPSTHPTTSHNEPQRQSLYTGDLEEALKFYVQLFGWKPKNEVTGVTFFDHGGEHEVASLVHHREPGVVPQWVPYFAAASVDTSCTQAAMMGGAVVLAPVTVAKERRAVLRDGQGARFGLFGQVDSSDSGLPERQ